MPSAFDLIDSGGGSGSGAQTDVSFLLFSCHRMALRQRAGREKATSRKLIAFLLIPTLSQHPENVAIIFFDLASN